MALTKEQKQAYQREYRQKNGERIREKQRERNRAAYYADVDAARAKARERTKAYRERHKDTKKEQWREARRRVTLAEYNLTPEMYAEMLDKQQNRCKICGTEDPVHWSGRFQIDHCHTTGKVRGLLCSPCNGGMGMFKDRIDILESAISYLKEAESAEIR